MTARHRRTKPRFGRIALAATACTVTVVALAGGVGLMTGRPPARQSAVAAGATFSADDVTSEPSPTSRPDLPAQGTDPSPSPGKTTTPEADASEPAEAQLARALPADSGRGRRIVFSESRQRVWLVSGGQKVKRTYRVSGSVYDNLDPGTYEVYSRSEDAFGVDGSTMHWFVRFTRGTNAAIGFHTIPELGGSPVQTVAQLGTPLSHGCIRQDERDARALWFFGQLGTTVVVTA